MRAHVLCRARGDHSPSAGPDGDSRSAHPSMYEKPPSRTPRGGGFLSRGSRGNICAIVRAGLANGRSRTCIRGALSTATYGASVLASRAICGRREVVGADTSTGRARRSAVPSCRLRFRRRKGTRIRCMLVGFWPCPRRLRPSAPAALTPGRRTPFPMPVAGRRSRIRGREAARGRAATMGPAVARAAPAPVAARATPDPAAVRATPARTAPAPAAARQALAPAAARAAPGRGRAEPRIRGEPP